MKKFTMALLCLSAVYSASAFAGGWSISIGIPAPVYVAPPPPVYVAPAPMVYQQCQSTEVYNGSYYYSSTCITQMVDPQIIVDPYMRGQMMTAIGACAIYAGPVTYYDPRCVNAIQIDGVAFWERVRPYHERYYAAHPDFRIRREEPRDPYRDRDPRFEERGRGYGGYGRPRPGFRGSLDELQEKLADGLNAPGKDPSEILSADNQSKVQVGSDGSMQLSQLNSSGSANQ